jgi:Fe2+ transport system protein FeoA
MFSRCNPSSLSLSDATGPVAEAARPLAAISEGAGGIVVAVLPSASRVRCMEVGLVPGVYVRVLKTGSVMLLSVNGRKLGISRECLTEILVSTRLP